MQLSGPRSQTVGKIQDQLQQRGQVAQDHMAANQNKEDEKNRTQVTEASDTEKKRLNNDDESGSNEKNSNHDNQKQQNKQEREEIYAKHPYKGNFIDFSG